MARLFQHRDHLFAAALRQMIGKEAAIPDDYSKFHSVCPIEGAIACTSGIVCPIPGGVKLGKALPAISLPIGYHANHNGMHIEVPSPPLRAAPSPLIVSLGTRVNSQIDTRLLQSNESPRDLSGSAVQELDARVRVEHVHEEWRCSLEG